MAPKKGKKKNKVVMALADFNPEASVGTPQELKDLPSAPKQAEEWEAVGGRPEYNSRGFKERTVTHDYDDNALLESDEAFLQRDWTRGANFVAEDDSGGGAGAGGVERSWDGMRRSGPLDDPDGDGAERDFGMARGGMGPVDSSFDAAGPERDFGAARGGAGPIDASFDAAGGADRDFGAARGGAGPIDASFDAAGGADRDFGAARGGAGPVDASFDAAGGADRDFGAARGSAAFDAEFESRGGNVDFGGARSGSAAFDAEFAGAGKEVDFAKRTGPVDAEFADAKNVDFGAARGNAAFDAEFQGAGKEINFAAKRAGPVDAEFASQQKDVDFRSARGGGGAFEADFGSGNAGSERDMNNMRAGSKVSEMARQTSGGDFDFGGARKSVMSDARAGSSDVPPAANRDWSARKGPLDAHPARQPQGARDFGAARRNGSDTLNSVEPVSDTTAKVNGARESINPSPSDSAAPPPKERDWGRARRTQPLPTQGRDMSKRDQRDVTGLTAGMTRAQVSGDSQSMPASRNLSKPESREDDSSDWTTVRSAPRPSHGRGSAPFRGRGGSGNRPAHLVSSEVSGAGREDPVRVASSTAPVSSSAARE